MEVRSWWGEGGEGTSNTGTEVGDSFHLWQTVELGQGMAPTSLLGSEREGSPRDYCAWPVCLS